MKKISKIMIGVLLIVLLTVNMQVTGAVSKEDVDESIEQAKLGLNDNESQNDDLLKFGQDEFKQMENDAAMYKTIGIIPGSNTREQQQVWLGKLSELRAGLAERGLDKYFYSKGPVIRYDRDLNGYLVIGLYENSTFSDSHVTEIYSIVDEYAQSMGIQDVPVVFRIEGLAEDVSLKDGEMLPEQIMFGLTDSELYGRNIPDFGPEVFEKMKDNPRIYKTIGIIPRFETEEERINWIDILIKLGTELKGNGLEGHNYPEGIVFGRGTSIDGYYSVNIYENSTFNESQVDEVYSIIDKKAQSMGIQNVPVAFEITGYPQEDVFPPMDTITLIKAAPALGLFGGLVALFIGWRLVKR